MSAEHCGGGLRESAAPDSHHHPRQRGCEQCRAESAPEDGVAGGRAMGGEVGWGCCCGVCAGLDSAEFVSQLRVLHAQGKHEFGVDVTGCKGVVDAKQEGIIEAYKSKLSQICFAAEAAEMVGRCCAEGAPRLSASLGAASPFLSAKSVRVFADHSRRRHHSLCSARAQGDVRGVMWLVTFNLRGDRRVKVPAVSVAQVERRSSRRVLLCDGNKRRSLF